MSDDIQRFTPRAVPHEKGYRGAMVESDTGKYVRLDDVALLRLEAASLRDEVGRLRATLSVITATDCYSRDEVTAMARAALEGTEHHGCPVPYIRRSPLEHERDLAFGSEAEFLRSTATDIETGEPLDDDARPDLYAIDARRIAARIEELEGALWGIVNAGGSYGSLAYAKRVDYLARRALGDDVSGLEQSGT